MRERCVLHGVRALASILRTGVPLRAALVAWTRHAPRRMQQDLDRLARRLELGQDTVAAVEDLVRAWGPELRPLSTAIGLHTRLGGDAAQTLDAIAVLLEDRDEDERNARAACSGVRLSGRMVASLPLAVAPLVPRGQGALHEPIGLLLSMVGVALGGAGLWWIDRLLPRFPKPDEVAEAAALIAGGLGAGASLGAGFEALAERPPVSLAGDLGRARRVVRLGRSWPEALSHASDGGLRELGAVLVQASRAGHPLEERLRTFTRARRAATRSRLEAEVRRAPVLMTLPLVLCVLPSFALLAIAPLAQGSL